MSNIWQRIFQKPRLDVAAHEMEQHWSGQTRERQRDLLDGLHDWKYLEMVRLHCFEGVNWYKGLTFFYLPLLAQAERIVELGTSFSYYPAHYDSRGAWGVSSAGD